MPSGYLSPRRLAWQWFDLQFINHSQSMSLHPLISAWFQSSSISFKRPTSSKYSNNLYQPAFFGKVLHSVVCTLCDSCFSVETNRIIPYEMAKTVPENEVRNGTHFHLRLPEALKRCGSQIYSTADNVIMIFHEYLSTINLSFLGQRKFLTNHHLSY